MAALHVDIVIAAPLKVLASFCRNKDWLSGPRLVRKVGGDCETSERPFGLARSLDASGWQPRSAAVTNQR